MAGQPGKSGGKRPGAGRKIQFSGKHDDFVIVHRQTIGGPEFKEQAPELGRICGVNKNELEIQIGNDILVIRFPEVDEITIKG